VIGDTATLIVNLRTNVVEVNDERHTPRVKTSSKEPSVPLVQIVRSTPEPASTPRKECLSLPE
jgi:hypothetical protein